MLLSFLGSWYLSGSAHVIFGSIVNLIIYYRRFIRTHCKYIAAQNNSPPLRRSQSFFLNNKQQELATSQEKSREHNSSEIQVISPTPANVTTNLLIQSSSETKKFPYDTHILNDVQSLSSSPQALSIHLPPENEVHTQNPATGVEFVMTTSISSKPPPKLITYGKSFAYYC